jgi:hypothetical protein
MKQKIIEILLKFLFPNLKDIILTIGKGVKWMIDTFLKPFWFSTSNGKKDLVAPYFYVSIGMIFFYASIYIFLTLSYKGATVGIQDAGIILPTLAGVIATLIGMVTITMNAYNKGKSTNIEAKKEDKPKGVQE